MHWQPPGIGFVTAITIFLIGAFAFRSPAADAQAAQGRSKNRVVPLGLDAYMAIPPDNPLTPAKAALGRQLFFDRLLSRDRTMSCASCHDPQRAFTDGRAVSVGVFGRKGRRNVPTLVNRGYGVAHFWDGRASSLEAQVLQPIQESKELDLTVDEALARLRQSRRYRELFLSAFGEEINSGNLAKALASYIRTIVSGNSRFDRYVRGRSDALSKPAREGLRLFRGKANCSSCHLGPNLTDERFHNTGVAWRDGHLLDPGRFAVTGQEKDQGAFKPPTLREIARTAPYMHDGSLETLKEVVEFYNRGGNPNPHLDPDLRPLNLTSEEKQYLLAFLSALTGTTYEAKFK